MSSKKGMIPNSTLLSLPSVPHTGNAVCTVCGAALESWSESTHVPTYELIERPDRKPE